MCSVNNSRTSINVANNPIQRSPGRLTLERQAVQHTSIATKPSNRLLHATVHTLAEHGMMTQRLGLPVVRDEEADRPGCVLLSYLLEKSGTCQEEGEEPEPGHSSNL